MASNKAIPPPSMTLTRSSSPLPSSSSALSSSSSPSALAGRGDAIPHQWQRAPPSSCLADYSFLFLQTGLLLLMIIIAITSVSLTMASTAALPLADFCLSPFIIIIIIIIITRASYYPVSFSKCFKFNCSTGWNKKNDNLIIDYDR